jgi:hypothetical protein
VHGICRSPGWGYASGGDHGASAAAVRESLKARRFVATGARDFEHTLALLKKAGVSREFAFAY